MIARVPATTGLLAATAFWGLGLLVLALLGLGGTVGPHPENPALAPPLPAVSLVEMENRLGPLSMYAEVAERPLLNADRRPAPVAASAGAEDAPLDVVLTSVLLVGDVKLAIVERPDDPTAYRVRIGEGVPGTGWRLVELQPRLAVFDGPQGRRELALRVFDGTGAPMPPPLAAPTPPAPANAAAPPSPAADAAAPVPAPASDGANVAAPANPGAAEELTPEQQVEAIRRRIEARRAMRAQENARERAAQAGDNR
ncbi:hypothetical protein [Arenimonas composti]|uniref:General secretion pathway protein N n=1 Tax=Arenimonas composti TR7-09 = DSM 18010 TaxID=1121013 RepID=A0A091BIG4_9GAMM|nr:hypothetical protein [Arenimonas composti]KFN51322.1 hypothetical protein P873_03380 [Arenimonas composti TR7-09 = DSM 18010]